MAACNCKSRSGWRRPTLALWRQAWPGGCTGATHRPDVSAPNSRSRAFDARTWTVFAATPPNERGIRIWNRQLIRYAGYRTADGVILGDSEQLEFTSRVMELGWCPPTERSAFDVLPLVIDFPGQAPKQFNLPTSCVLEIPITHPEFAWFAYL